ncbi:TPA: recombinase family protein, partial [Escherichia coli]|nr:recombinase family protein [Escherichia coli]HAI5538187.1 recombinase family protein [Escherichia coli]
MLIGYARVSRDKQETALQLDALDKAGCQRVYVEKLSGASTERPELERCLGHCCKVSDEAAFC